MDGGQSLGTGVIISSDGEILTNAHVVDGATSIRVRLAGETEPREANLLAMDTGNDLALLRMDGDGFEAATFADPDSVRLGDDVIAIGSRSASTVTRRSRSASCRHSIARSAPMERSSTG